MQKFVITFVFCFVLTQTFSQLHRKVSTYLLTEYNRTLYDYTAGNNPWGIGMGLQVFLNNKTRFKPTIEFTADIYLEDDKVLRLNADGSFPQNGNSVSGMVNLFVGSSFHLTKSIYLSFVAGPSFISGHRLLGIKPSFGFNFSQNQRWTGKVSYINIFNRTQLTKEDFGSLSVGIGLKLF